LKVNFVNQVLIIVIYLNDRLQPTTGHYRPSPWLTVPGRTQSIAQSVNSMTVAFPSRKAQLVTQDGQLFSRVSERPVLWLSEAYLCRVKTEA
jgi:hypothetical protein